MAVEVKRCRISGKEDLVEILDLGVQALTGVFPGKGETAREEPVKLVWSPSSKLLQLGHRYELSEMYGPSYGYRSGLNQSMVRHLKEKVARLVGRYEVKRDGIFLDIGSNDGTLLGFVDPCMKRIGMDPTIDNFEEYYSPGITKVKEFFSGDEYFAVEGKKADAITSISMFYDLDSPAEFVNEISRVLARDGIWHFEQSYVLAMINTNSYDTICHEHYEFYSIAVINELLVNAGMMMIDLEFNKVNGGSVAVTAAHADSRYKQTSLVRWWLRNEATLGLDRPEIYQQFSQRAIEHRSRFKSLLETLVGDGQRVNGYGASTKGNVLLQYCGIGSDLIGKIGEVNTSKYGCRTPGSNIDIVPESEVVNDDSDFLVVLPWHFRDVIIEREREFLNRGGRLIFPFPDIEIV